MAAGAPAGTVKSVDGHLSYLQIRIDGITHIAHRLAWLHVYGQWPTDVVDHINGDGLDNRLSNLRAATKSQNQFNRRKARNNTSGRTGVWHLRKYDKWIAEIWVNDRKQHIGCYRTRDEAIAARIAAEQTTHGIYSRAAQTRTAAHVPA